MNEKLETIIEEVFDKLGIEYTPPNPARHGPCDPEIIQSAQEIEAFFASPDAATGSEPRPADPAPERP